MNKLKIIDKELNDRLYEKALDEQLRYREWLLSQPAEEILHHAYEYAVREDILYSLECSELDKEQTNALLSTEYPVSDILKDYEKFETDYMYDIFEAVKFRANILVLKNQAERTDCR